MCLVQYIDCQRFHLHGHIIVGKIERPPLYGTAQFEILMTSLGLPYTPDPTPAPPPAPAPQTTVQQTQQTPPASSGKVNIFYVIDGSEEILKFHFTFSE